MKRADLYELLKLKAEELAPQDPTYPDSQQYVVHNNPDALGDAWLDNRTSYIWRVGVLVQWDSNKCDYIHVFIGHERRPGEIQYIGHLHYSGGENDDPGRCLARAVVLAQSTIPALEDE